MPSQLEITSIHTPAPAVTPEEIDRVCRALKGLAWVTRSEIEHVVGMSERKLRAVAEHSEGRIISGPGTPGYRLFESFAQNAEADRAASALESQAQRMILRAKSLRQRSALHRALEERKRERAS